MQTLDLYLGIVFNDLMSSTSQPEQRHIPGLDLERGQPNTPFIQHERNLAQKGEPDADNFRRGQLSTQLWHETLAATHNDGPDRKRFVREAGRRFVAQEVGGSSWEHSKDAHQFYKGLLIGNRTISPADREFCDLMMRSHAEYLATNAPPAVAKIYRESLNRMVAADRSNSESSDSGATVDRSPTPSFKRRVFLGGLSTIAVGGAAILTKGVVNRLTSHGDVTPRAGVANETSKPPIELKRKQMEELREKHPNLFTMSVQAHEKLDDRLANQIDVVLLTFLAQPPAQEYRNAAGQMVRVDLYDKNPGSAPGKRAVCLLRFTPGPWVPDVYMDRHANANGEIVWDQVAYTLDGNKNLAPGSDRNEGSFSPDILKQMYDESCKMKLRGDVWWNDRIKQGLEGRGYDKPSGIYDTCNGSRNGWMEVIRTQKL